MKMVMVYDVEYEDAKCRCARGEGPDRESCLADTLMNSVWAEDIIESVCELNDIQDDQDIDFNLITEWVEESGFDRVLDFLDEYDDPYLIELFIDEKPLFGLSRFTD